MKLKTVIKQITAVLNFPKALGNFIIYARAILMAMTNNDYFTAYVVDIKKLGVDIASLEEIETACKTRPATKSIEQRDAALELVKMDLRTLRNHVQNVANANPRMAKAIITSAAMAVKNSATHGKQKNAAINGTEKGSVMLTGEGAGAHDWRMAIDGINWIAITPTFISKTIVYNLKSNIIYYFQNRTVGAKNHYGEWCQSIMLLVK